MAKRPEPGSPVMRQMTQLETWRVSRATPAMLNMPHLIMSLTFYSICRTFAFVALLLPLAAQPKVGYVEVYGVRKLSKDRIIKTIGAAPGSELPRSKGAVEERLVALDGVALAQMEAFCCDEGRLILYVGIQERGMPLFEYRPAPDEEVFLPAEVSEAYAEFTAALGRAAAAGDLAEDLTAGHSLMRNPACRTIQARFVWFGGTYLGQLRAVLARSADPEQRAMAAYIIGYAADKKAVIDDLQAGLRDPEPEVRSTAARALRAIAVLGRDKSLGVQIRATWFVEMLNSVALADRIEGSRTLNLMFDDLSEGALTQIRERALPSLLEMARWTHLPHALPPYLLLGRVAGIAEAEMSAAWEEGKREEMLARIEKALLPKKK